MTPGSLVGLTLFAAAVTAIALAALQIGGRGRRHDAGWQAWRGATTATLVGCLLTAALLAVWPAAGSRPPGVESALVAGPRLGLALLALLLLATAPVVALCGLRRFFVRRQLPGSERQDAAVLGLAMALLLAAAVLQTLPSGAGALTPAAVATFPAPDRIGVWLGDALPGWLAALGLALPAAHTAQTVLRAPLPDRARRRPDAAGIALRAWAVLLLLGSGAALRWPGAWLAGAGLASASPGVAPAVVAALAALAAATLAFAVHGLAQQRLVARLQASRRRLKALADMDALTQLPNRRRFHELATRALPVDPSASAVLLAFDIDHFKQINDRLGHAAGDRALRLVALAMVEQLRADDVPGRHGGDEFVLLLRRTGTADAMRAAARIVAAVQQRAAPAGLPPLGLSFGLVQVASGEALDEALRRADQALYEAKRQGRSRAVAATGDEAHPVFSESQRLGLV
jgi:diguanylate cyclase